jgi:hypothetical protein
VGDDHAVSPVLVEDLVDQRDEIEQVRVLDRLAGEPPERDLLHVGDRRQFRDAGDEFAVLEPLARLDVEGKVEPVDTDRIDRPAGEDQGNPWTPLDVAHFGHTST